MKPTSRRESMARIARRTGRMSGGRAMALKEFAFWLVCCWRFSSERSRMQRSLN
jgi:hypothetical protein